MILGEKEENLPELYKKVLVMIPKGSDKPVKVSEISKLTGIGSVTVREIVSKLRVTYGYKIGTSNEAGRSGYYIIETAEEKEATIRNLRSRAYKILKVANAIENGPDPYQQEMIL